jgi:hypothetical protein
MDVNPYESPNVDNATQSGRMKTTRATVNPYIWAFALIVGGLVLHATAISHHLIGAAGMAPLLSICGAFWLAVLLWRSLRG